MPRLRDGASGVTRGLAAHVGWTESELLPALDRYSKLTPGYPPERERELGLQYMTAFMEQSGALLDPWHRPACLRGGDAEGALKLAADQLTQGCYILKELLLMEKELLFPLVDDVLTDMDYLFA